MLCSGNAWFFSVSGIIACRTGFTYHYPSWKDKKPQRHTLNRMDWLLLHFFFRNRPSPEEEEPSKVNTDPGGKVGALHNPELTPTLKKKKQHCHRVALMRSTILWIRHFILARTASEIKPITVLIKYKSCDWCFMKGLFITRSEAVDCLSVISNRLFCVWVPGGRASYHLNFLVVFVSVFVFIFICRRNLPNYCSNLFQCFFGVQSFAVRSLGWVEMAEEDLAPGKSSVAVNNCIRQLSYCKNDIRDTVGIWGEVGNRTVHASGVSGAQDFNNLKIIEKKRP